MWAGPYAGKLLAFLGAEVIKVESSTHPDEMRAYGGTDINHAPYFLSINPEVLSVELNLKSAADVDRLADLISHSDIVINNLRPGAMERLGLGYGELRTVKQDIISVSIKMWGNDGPLGYQTGYAPCFAALAGVASLVGYPGGPPLGTSMRYGDSTVGAAAAFAAVAALLHRDLTGEGQFVDVSAVETLSSMIGDCLLAQELTGTQLMPDGNRHADMAPHNCYPCSGGDWISIAVADDDQWRQLCDVLGAAALVDDKRYQVLADRLSHTDALDVDIADLTARHDAGALAQRLQAAGVPATKSATALDIISDSLLWDRELTASSAITAKDNDRCSQRRGGCRSPRLRSRAVRPISVSTTTMFVTRSLVPTQWRSGARDSDFGRHGGAGDRRQQRHRRRDGAGAGSSRRCRRSAGTPRRSAGRGAG